MPATSTTITPQKKPPKLIVVMAFDRDEEGELRLYSVQTSSRARTGQCARALVGKHVGVIA